MWCRTMWRAARDLWRYTAKTWCWAIIKERIDPGVAKTGKISDDNASTLINMNYLVNHVLPVKDEMISVYESYIAANKVEKPISGRTGT